MPSLFMINITKSTASPPICRPQLPPTTLKGAGALHPVAVRQLATPLPYSAPNTKPPFLSDGTTPTQRAVSIRSWGIPLSGAAIISSRTSTAAFTRFTSSSRSSAYARLTHPSRTALQSTILRIEFLVISSPLFLFVDNVWSCKYQIQCRPWPGSLTHEAIVERGETNGHRVEAVAAGKIAPMKPNARWDVRYGKGLARRPVSADRYPKSSLAKSSSKAGLTKDCPCSTRCNATIKSSSASDF